ncbi:endonuclease domain-containing protein [Flagellimonas myxillae]|uniref:endonuclease domain-containing protein n=1 Tax=Flagellimonas myxillae TaxID=2942214 RepID=UPI00201F4E52|nr:endonuclease domain-containing protein [Muricauda myxillae]MCL6267813.1 endonuclease domain-containing protein [Muricauda myxillae]
MRRHNKRILKQYRKDLRKNLTPAEVFLWTKLQRKQLDGRKFRRQHSIDNFIVDFYCVSEKLIIELDGQVHFNAVAQEKDYFRTQHLEGLGLTVLRFENKMVFENLPSVLQEIREHFG